jgi:hypothetical protein
MSTSQPPRLASWLLQHLASSPKPESLVGDLIEQYRNGRSATWYWRQVLTAIVVGATRDIRAHKLLAIRAVAIGWLLYVLLSFPVNWLAGASRVWVTNWLVDTGRYSFWWVFWSGHLLGTLLVYVACAVSGWIVARLHQAHSVAVVSLYAASVLLFEYGMICWMFSQHGYPPIPQAALILPLFLTIGRPISIFIGGLWAVRSGRDATLSIPAQ